MSLTGSSAVRAAGVGRRPYGSCCGLYPPRGAEEVVEALKWVIAKDTIMCLTPTTLSWQVTLSSQCAWNALLSLGICLRDHHLNLTSIGVPPTFVSIEVLFELSNDRICLELSEYSKVYPFVLRRKYWFADTEMALESLIKLYDVSINLWDSSISRGTTSQSMSDLLDNHLRATAVVQSHPLWVDACSLVQGTPEIRTLKKTCQALLRYRQICHTRTPDS